MVSDHQRAFGIFSSREAAGKALHELKNANFPMDKVSIIAKDADPNDRIGDTPMSDRIGNKEVGSATAVVADAVTGATWGTILVGLTSLALPGIGPVLAAGSLGVALVGTLAGVAVGSAASNGLVTSLVDLGIPEETARIYSDRLLAGNYFAIVEGTQAEINHAEQVFSNSRIQDWAVYNSANG